MIETLLRDLRQPEYVHVLLNPLPIYGLAAGLIGLFISLFVGGRSARISSFVVIVLCALSAWPVAEFGERAYDPVLSMSDEPGQAWLKSHQERADKLIFLFYVLAAAAAGGIFASRKSEKIAFISAALVLILGLTTIGAGGYIAYAGGRIRHREFRNGPSLPP